LTTKPFKKRRNTYGWKYTWRFLPKLLGTN